MSDALDAEVSAEVDTDALETDTAEPRDSDPDTAADSMKQDSSNREDVEDEIDSAVVTCDDEGKPCEGLGECGPGVVECVAEEARCSSEPWGSASEMSDEICDGLDNDCDGVTDEGFGEGDLVVLQGARFSGDDGKVLSDACGVGVCAGGVVTCGEDGLSLVCSSELNANAVDSCNGVDDDCDGTIDDDFALVGTPGFKPLGAAAYAVDNGKAKGAVCGTGACTRQGAGVVECSADGTRLECSSDGLASVELCDNTDNDCNGEIDDPFVRLTGMTLQSAKFSGDDGKVKGADCGVGVCAGGRVSCADSELALVCDGDAAASVEVCDGVDNDCDGETDLQFKYQSLPLGAVCNGVGECGSGVVVCTTNKALATCSTNADGTNSQASPEVCDAADNDCDGQTDEGLTYGGVAIGGPCNGVGECGVGVVQCNTARASTCSTNPDGVASQATTEICDGQDNDCDGATDDNCSAVCSPLCQNNGDCQVGNACDCMGTGYSGSRCQTPVCASGCGLGTCSAPNTCNCSGTGYSGSRCEIPICSASCLNGGTCTGPSTCTCPSGWIGSRCEQAVCSPSCGSNGTCTAPQQCTCAANWTGNRCETPVCTGNCNNNGTCVGAQQCSCSAGWTGSRCETAVCTTSCGAHGNCSAPNTCLCDAGWGGAQCNQPVCASPCQNGGTCTAPSTCSCPPGLSGAQCQTLTGFVRIPAGTFTMGSPSNEVGRDPPDDPDAVETQHQVTITRPYWMKTTEVTQTEWFARIGTSPSSFSGCGGSCPVEEVFLLDAMAFANALSAFEGLSFCYDLSDCWGTVGIDYQCLNFPAFVGLACDGYRLPTEAEWEYAARAGTTTATYNGNITQSGSGPEPVLSPIAWIDATSADRPRNVNGRGANAWGLYDMLGNVAEWVHDGFTPYGSAPATDPIGPWAEGIIVRGGAWNQPARRARAAWRGLISDQVRLSWIGFRVVRTTQ